MIGRSLEACGMLAILNLPVSCMLNELWRNAYIIGHDWALLMVSCTADTPLASVSTGFRDLRPLSEATGYCFTLKNFLCMTVQSHRTIMWNGTRLIQDAAITISLSLYGVGRIQVRQSRRIRVLVETTSEFPPPLSVNTGEGKLRDNNTNCRRNPNGDKFQFGNWCSILRLRGSLVP